MSKMVFVKILEPPATASDIEPGRKAVEALQTALRERLELDQSH